MKIPAPFSATLALGFLLSCSFTSAIGAPILQVDFESAAAGPYTDDMVKTEWQGAQWSSLFDRAQIAPDKQPGSNKVLKIAYPKGSLGPQTGGGQLNVTLPPTDELWLSYRVRFEPGFDFTKGGKLPGLTSGGGKYTGGKVPTEGDGWSARFMWKSGGRICLYLYYVDMPGGFGENVYLEGVHCKPGVWYRIVEHVKVNTPGQKDGLVEAWFDGKKVASRTNIRFRIGTKGLIDSFYFSTFHGGNTPDWSPTVDSFASFDDFTISKESLENNPSSPK